jgi:ribonuclease HI
MVDTAECKLCGADEDTWDHALLYCTMSRCVWAQLDEEVTELIANICISNPMHWVSFICSNISQADGMRILVTCWAIWQARRKTIYDEIFQSPLSIIAKINMLIDELEFIEEFQRKEMYQPQLKSKKRHWIPPESGQCKINTDAAIAKDAYKGAIGVICRNDQGGFIVASALVIPNIIEPETLEAMACEEALALAEDCGIKKITVASDCLNVIKNIKDMSRCSYMMIIQSINGRARSFDYVRFAHEGRDCNREAHYLAKHACTLKPGRHVWLGYPPVFLDVNVAYSN